MPPIPQSYFSGKFPCDVDMLPNWDAIYSGFLLKQTKSIWIFIGFNWETRLFDGYCVYRDKHVERYRKWDMTDFKDAKRWNQEKYFDVLPLDRMNSLVSTLKVASEFGLIEIYDRDDLETFFVGKLISVNRDTAKFKLVAKSGEWSRTRSFKIPEIDFIAFDTRYVRKLNKKLGVLKTEKA